MKRHFRHINANRGVTLLELSVVMMILVILLMFAVPNMRGLQERNKLITTSRKIASLTRYARAEAINGERETQIRIDVKKHRFRLDLMKINTEILGSYDRKNQKRGKLEQIEYLPKFVYFKSVSTEEDPLGRDKVATISFFPDGSATGTSIILENNLPRKDRKPRYLGIYIAHTTGLPEVFELNEEELQEVRKMRSEDYNVSDSSSVKEDGDTMLQYDFGFDASDF